MAITAAELLVRIGVDETLQRDLSSASRKVNGFADSVGGKLSRGIGGAFKSLGGYALKGAAVAGTALAGMGAAAVASAAEAEQVAAQTAAAIESTGGAANVSAKDVDALAQSIMQMSGISDEAVGSAENLLLTFTNIRNETGAGNDVFNQATLAVADLSTRMGGDMQGAALQVGKALNDPVKGISALTRVGVSFTDAQKEQIKALAESGDMMGAQKIILGELTKEFGGSAKAAGDTFTGQLNIAKETIGNTMEEIGGTLIKSIGPALPKLAKVLGDVFKKLGPTIGKVVDGIGTVLEKLMPAIGPLLDVLGTAFIEVIDALAPAIGPVATALVELIKAIVPILPPIARLIATLLPPLADLLANYVAPAIEAVVTWLSNAVDWVIDFVSSFGDLWKAMKDMGGKIYDAIADTFAAAADWVTEKWNAIVTFFTNLPSKIANTFRSIRDSIINAFKAAINAVIGMWNALDTNFSFKIFGQSISIPDVFPDIPYLAKGGIITRPTLAMIGEAGPEAVVPLNQMRQASPLPVGGGGSNLTVNVVLDRKTFARQQDYYSRASGL